MRKDEVSRLVDGTSDPAFVVDPDGVMAGWNHAASNWFGRSTDQALGRSCAALMQGVDEDGSVCSEMCVVRQAMLARHPLPNFDLRLNTVRGPEWCNLAVMMVPVQGSATPFAVHLLRSVDASRRLEVNVRSFVTASTGLPAAQVRISLASRRPATPVVDLSPRELEVLNLLAGGASSRSVAEKLFISRTTVNNHVGHILRKLGAHTRLEAVRRAERAGLI